MKYIFELNSDNNYKIEFKKSDLKYDTTVFEEYDKLYNKVKNESKKDKDIEYRDIRTRFFKENGKGLLFILNYYGFREYNTFVIDGISVLNKFNVEKLIINNNNNNNKSYNLKLRINDILFKKIINSKQSKRQLLHNKCIIIALYNLYNILEIGGNLYLQIYNYTSFITFEIIYLLLIFFEKIIFITGKNR